MRGGHFVAVGAKEKARVLGWFSKEKACVDFPNQTNDDDVVDVGFTDSVARMLCGFSKEKVCALLLPNQYIGLIDVEGLLPCETYT